LSVDFCRPFGEQAGMKIPLRLYPLVLSLALVACNTQVSALVRVADVAAGSTCANGGAAIETGFDKNGNGVLDDDEVDASRTKTLCSGTPGVSGMPGTNGNNGSAGDAGVNGLTALTKLSSEPAGANCKFGGARVDTGLDTNGNGTLESSEVTATQYVCDSSNINNWFFGDVHITAASDLAMLDGIQVIVGGLFFDGPFGADVSFPDLQVVTGDVSLTSGNGGGTRPVTPRPSPLLGLNSLSFPALTRVSGSISLKYQEDLTSYSMPRLVSASYIEFQYNDRLASVDFSSLVAVPGNSLYLNWSPVLTDVKLTRLARLDYLQVYGNPSLVTLALPALTTISSMDIENNSLLATLSMPVLTNANNVTIAYNPALAACPFFHLATTPGHPNLSIISNADTCTGFDLCDAVAIPGITGTVRGCHSGMNYDAAQTLCRTLDGLPDGGTTNVDGGLGSNLIWFESQAEWLAFQGVVLDGGFPQFNLWLGYSDRVTEGTWLAESGFTGYAPMADPDAGFWSPGQPDNSGAIENDTELWSNGLANDTIAKPANFPVCRTP
jgi:hypothetical protein